MHSTRREAAAFWFTALLVSISSPLVGRTPGNPESGGRGGVSAAEGLAAMLSDGNSAAGVGRAYLRQHPGDADPEGLARQVLRDAPELAGHLESRRYVEARRALLDRHRADLAQARTVRLQGWILSETEARLYALAALVRG